MIVKNGTVQIKLVQFFVGHISEHAGIIHLHILRANYHVREIPELFLELLVHCRVIGVRDHIWAYKKDFFYRSITLILISKERLRHPDRQKQRSLDQKRWLTLVQLPIAFSKPESIT